MPFLPPNQQRQSTEGNKHVINYPVAVFCSWPAALKLQDCTLQTLRDKYAGVWTLQHWTMMDGFAGQTLQD